MLSVIGTVIKKERKYTKNKADLIVKDSFGNIHPFEVRKNELIKIIEVKEDDNVKVSYRIETSERLNKKTNEYNRIPNEILMDLEVL
ncbi:hypothetical protein R8G64_03180 [Tenacibaculum maritimum]|uniref:hypothetical protein n=1 Tax=Tenacibaculum maritimum TaxID=107401 RepID=UPI0012E67F46|nr:hypothetical protein [Tenacibaculum maritimum]CAA0253847.1 hypothetical protein DPIF8902391_90059 [Tenacibaculum maritimum]